MFPVIGIDIFGGAYFIEFRFGDLIIQTTITPTHYIMARIYDRHSKAGDICKLKFKILRAAQDAERMETDGNDL